MPKDLAALLLADGAVSAEVLARAQARQREAGGALDTALLEEGALAEATLNEYLARAADLPAAPESAWSGADTRARRVFPSRVADRHGLAPFALEGRELSLVATHPVDLELLDEISFMLSLHLTAHVGPEWRVRELIHRLYGSPLTPRLAAIAAVAGEAPAPPPGGVAPPEEEAPPPPEESPPEPPPEAPLPASARFGFARDVSEPSEPLAAALELALEEVDPSLFDDEGGAEAPDDQEAAAEPPEPEGPPPDRSAPPHWSLDDARSALAAARHRDEVVLAALRYARDFFEYASVFAVTRDAVAGHDALGVEDERDRARSVAIYVADPGTFKTVIETTSPYLGPVSRDASGNVAVLDGLGRGIPRTALVYPVLLRDRTVCILYADNGEAPVSPRRLGDLLLFLSTVGAAFERIIRDRKRGRKRQGPAAPPPREPPAPEEPIAETSPPQGMPALDLSAGPPAGISGPGDQAESRPPEDVAVDRGATFEPGARAPPPAEPEPEPWRATDPLRAIEEKYFSPDGPDIEVDISEDVPPPDAVVAAPAPGPAPPAEASSLPELADRALDADAAVSAEACAALAERRRDPAIRQAVEKLRRALLSGISDRATRAARAIGALRDVETIPLLIQALDTSEPGTASAAADALAGITLQRIGNDPRKWLAWWKQNRGRGRAEWLFSGLTSADRETRVAASAELTLAAPPPVAYSPDAPAAERERVAREWAGWWARSGHVL